MKGIKAMKLKLSKRAKGNIFLYGYLFVIFALGFICGCTMAKQHNPVEKQEVKVEQKADQNAKEEQPTEEKAQYKEITVVATAYCPCNVCCGKCDGITATGTKATAGRTIAVDPSFIPYGTEVIINGNTYIAEDCGGAIKGNRVDIYFATHQEALNFGRRTVTAYIKAA